MNGIEPEIVFTVGPVAIADTVVTTWAVMGVLVCVAAIAGRRLKLYPRGWQMAVETAATGVDTAIEEVMGRDPRPFFPLIATMWLMIAVANLTGLVPGLISPTRDMSTAGALAAISFFSVHYFGIRFSGFRGYIKHYFEPVFILFPFHIISELSRTLALMLRLFGNVLSGEMVAGVLLLVAGFLVPVPFALLEFVVAILQAYIFGMLTLIFIAAGVKTAERTRSKPAPAS
jgi:F-type H+-transporting ATPase subunit a